jgi:hypothetical protein
MTTTVRMTERDLQRCVMNLAKLLQWKTYHTWLSARSAPGFPDIIAVRGERLLAIELKSATGKVSEAQEQWLFALGGVPGVSVYVWRPDDWHSGEIERVLR